MVNKDYHKIIITGPSGYLYSDVISTFSFYFYLLISNTEKYGFLQVAHRYAMLAVLAAVM